MASDRIATSASSGNTHAHEADDEMDQIVGEEEKVLARVTRTIGQKRGVKRGQLIDYDAELLALRDQIRTARLEDIPPLIEEMERLQGVAARRAAVQEGNVDPSAPYFGRLVLEENDKRREVLIGRSTFLDPKTGVRIVDWRDAPVSRIYYRYDEGDDYEETFGDRDVEGEVLVRRALTIGQARLRRIGSPQGVFVKKGDGTWRRAGQSAVKLSGGQGQAMRPEKHHKPGKLGAGDPEVEREDKGLSEITALIDPRQFDIITKPTSGLVVIQGGAGSGKTTIGLHRLAYLAFQDAKRFRADKMLVVVFNDALVRYIGRVLPALGVEGVSVMTYEKWAAKLRKQHLSGLPTEYSEDTPGVVTRLKKHPVVLRLLEGLVANLEQEIDDAIADTGKRQEGGARVLRVWRATAGNAIGIRMTMLRSWLKKGEDGANEVGLEARHSVERTIERGLEKVDDVAQVWAELLTDLPRLQKAFAEQAPDAFTPSELSSAHAWCARRIPAAIEWRDDKADAERDRAEGEEVRDDGDEVVGVDGASENEVPTLDREDDAILLRLHQRLRGPLLAKRDRLEYEHIFVDETQDLSPLELAVVVDTTSKGKSITLAGDVAQKLYMDNGFSSWDAVLADLGLDHVQIEPLKLSYRSTFEILEFATDVLGPLRNEVSGEATRHGAPVELFRFTTSGEAVAFLGEALRDLARSEPLASIAIIARYPEQADEYFLGLKHAEVPNLRRIAEQDFPFRAGVDVTDVRQVKGLEFDYVILVDVNLSAFPEDDESRHLLHIAATRAAHQLWVTTTASPSMLVPEKLREQV
ncbi:MAG: ATP-binding domain-containing protein [Sandaracinus sp.]|nr:ATP-binding domain-containing protein [Sandaracinus sp.]